MRVITDPCRAGGRRPGGREVWTLAAGALLALLSSCASSADPCTGDPARDLRHADPACRCRAAVLAEAEGRLDLFPDLLANLDDEASEVRFYTGVAVRRLSGIDAEFAPFADAAGRRDAIERWRAWWDAYRSAEPPAAAAATPLGVAAESGGGEPSSASLRSGHGATDIAPLTTKENEPQS